MPEYFWICRMLSELGFVVEYVCICLRTNIVLRSEYISVLGACSCRLENRFQSTCVLAAQDEAHIVFVPKLEGEGSSRPAHCRPCRAHVVFVLKPEGEGNSRPAPRSPCRAHVVFVPEPGGEGNQSTCTLSSLRVGMIFILRRVLNCS